MRIRFQADADLNQTIVAAVLRRLPEADLRTAADGGLAGLHDLEVLALAARDGRLLVTSDRQTMPRHFGEFNHEDGDPGSDRRSPAASGWSGCGGRDSDLDRVLGGGMDEPHRLPAPLSAGIEAGRREVGDVPAAFEDLKREHEHDAES